MKDPSVSPFASSCAAGDLQKARKSPRQARSAATVDAILVATIQLLLRQGVGDLTTTRVAERAGVSVGTIYQYFPHKRALLYATLERHLGELAQAVETAAQGLEGTTLAMISDGLVAAFLAARTSDIATARAIYFLAADLDTAALLTGILHRIKTAVTRLLASASDARFGNIDAVSQMLCATLSGTTRTVLERAEPATLDIVKVELPLLCRAYLEAVAIRG